MTNEYLAIIMEFNVYNHYHVDENELLKSEESKNGI